jgi:hypothetical protein
MFGGFFFCLAGVAAFHSTYCLWLCSVAPSSATMGAEGLRGVAHRGLSHRPVDWHQWMYVCCCCLSPIQIALSFEAVIVDFVPSCCGCALRRCAVLMGPKKGPFPVYANLGGYQYVFGLCCLLPLHLGNDCNGECQRATHPSRPVPSSSTPFFDPSLPLPRGSNSNCTAQRGHYGQSVQGIWRVVACWHRLFCLHRCDPCPWLHCVPCRCSTQGRVRACVVPLAHQ